MDGVEWAVSSVNTNGTVRVNESVHVNVYVNLHQDKRKRKRYRKKKRTERQSEGRKKREEEIMKGETKPKHWKTKTRKDGERER